MKCNLCREERVIYDLWFNSSDFRMCSWCATPVLDWLANAADAGGKVENGKFIPYPEGALVMPPGFEMPKPTIGKEISVYSAYKPKGPKCIPCYTGEYHKHAEAK